MLTLTTTDSAGGGVLKEILKICTLGHCADIVHGNPVTMVTRDVLCLVAMVTWGTMVTRVNPVTMVTRDVLCLVAMVTRGTIVTRVNPVTMATLNVPGYHVEAGSIR